jgi:hypothetical protein
MLAALTEVEANVGADIDGDALPTFLGDCAEEWKEYAIRGKF